jgi:hypothetical protein
MRRKIRFIISMACILAGCLLTTGTISAVPSLQSTATPQVTATVAHVATQAELQTARLEWSRSKHANTYNNGMGANTTCASCKSPMNWDPASLAVDAAHDCASCKRVPGAPRPELVGGTPVPQSEWKNISCDICHQPMGDSYWTGISFWDQSTQSYIPMTSVKELCAKCHEGQHGFEVTEEQNLSPAHHDWECIRCHGPHGSVSKCTDCHDPKSGAGASEHDRHPSVSCTACHDQGGLSIWQEQNSASVYFGKFVPRRFAHTLRSWPSHNLARKVDCLRCHHQRNSQQPIVAQSVSCTACHPNGQGSFWCTNFQRNLDPNPTPATKIPGVPK